MHTQGGWRGQNRAGRPAFPEAALVLRLNEAFASNFSQQRAKKRDTQESAPSIGSVAVSQSLLGVEALLADGWGSKEKELP